MKQKGQGIIEFALIVPMLIALGVAIVYVGIMFMEFSQYSNAARDAARDISVQTYFTDANEDTTNASEYRQNIVDAINKGSGSDYETVISRYEHPFTNIFQSSWSAQFYALNSSTKKLETVTEASKADTVEVSISLKLKDGAEASGSYMSAWIADLFNLPTIHYKMVLE